MRFTKNIKKAIVFDYERFVEISNKIYWGDDPKKEIIAIYGDDAEKSAKEKGINIKGKLNPDTAYIFRYTKDRSGLVSLHVTMKPKTAANLMKGSARYGHYHIMQDI